MAYGYFTDEVISKPVNTIEKRVKFEIRTLDRAPRSIAQRALGIEDENLAMPFPDVEDAKSQIFGVLKRLAVKLPHVCLNVHKRMLLFIPRFFGLFFRPLTDDQIMDPMVWIETRPYTMARKQEHKDAWLAGEPENPCDTFMWVKKEPYDGYKHLRFICPMKDWTKMFMGPIATELDKQVFRLPCFIKKIPAANRVEYLEQLLDRQFSLISEADVTSMEAHMRKRRAKWLLTLVELFTKDLQKGEKYRYMLKKIVGYGKRTRSEAKNFVVKRLKRLCSGMNETSVFNSLLSVMLHYFILEDKFGVDLQKICDNLNDQRIEELMYETNIGPARLGSEGDDKIAAEEPGQQMTEQIYLEYGMACVPRHRQNIWGSDFCTMVFTQDHIMVTDVLYTYVTFGYGGISYLNVSNQRIDELIRARAMSLFHQYENCPVLHELARYAIRITDHIDMTRFFKKRNWGISQYEYDQMNEAYLYFQKRLEEKPFTEVQCPINTRLMVETLYNVTVDMQLEAESKLAKMDEKQQLNLFPHYLYPDSWLHYSAHYVRDEEIAAIKNRTFVPLAEYPTHSLISDAFWKDHARQFVMNGEQLDRQML